MSEETVNQVIEASLAEAETQQTDTVNKPTEQQSQESQENSGEDDTDLSPEERLRIGKKVTNALRRRENERNKYRAELQEARAKLKSYEDRYNTPQQQQQAQQQAQQQRSTVQAEAEPKIDDFDTLADYQKAVSRYEAKQLLDQYAKDQQKQFEEKERTTQQNAWVQQRQAEILTKSENLVKSNPEYASLWQQNNDLLDNMPEHVETAFYHAEDAPAAFFALAKEGRLEDLYSMPPHRVLMEIARAQDRGAAMLSQAKENPPVTKAPAPMAPARGTGVTTSDAGSMSGDQLLKAIRKK